VLTELFGITVEQRQPDEGGEVFTLAGAQMMMPAQVGRDRIDAKGTDAGTIGA
jgi:hypothetical protein